MVAAYTGLSADAATLGAIAAADVFLMSLYFGALVAAHRSAAAQRMYGGGGGGTNVGGVAGDGRSSTSADGIGGDVRDAGAIRAPQSAKARAAAGARTGLGAAVGLAVGYGVLWLSREVAPQRFPGAETALLTLFASLVAAGLRRSKSEVVDDFQRRVFPTLAGQYKQPRPGPWPCP